MPFGDKTGPMGFGPMTGRRAGYCAGFQSPGTMNPYADERGRGLGQRGFGRGCFGRGRSRANCYNMTGFYGVRRPRYDRIPLGQEYAPKDNVQDLKNQADFLKQQLDDIERRIKVLKKSQQEE